MYVWMSIKHFVLYIFSFILQTIVEKAQYLLNVL